MTDKQTLFISYCQKDGTEYADELEIQLRDDFDVKRDKSKLKTNDDIYGFMTEIADCDNVIIVLTDAYTKSLNCMLEMAFLFEQPDWDMKVTVLVIDESLYSLDRKLEVLTYWDTARRSADVVSDGIGQELLAERKNHINEICQQLEKFLMGVTRRKNPSQIAIVSEVKKNANKPGRQDEVKKIINKGENAVARILQEKGELTITEISKQTGRSEAATRRTVESLLEEGKIQTVGAGRNRKYKRNH